MKVPMIQSNKRILPNITINEVYELINKMKSKNTYSVFNNKNSFSQTTLTRLSIKNANNNRVSFAAPIEHLRENAEITCNKRKYLINPKTGDVKNISPFFKRIFEPFKTTVKNISNTISMLNKNFENPNVVTQHTVSIEGFTKKGAKLIKEAQKRVFGESL